MFLRDLSHSCVVIGCSRSVGLSKVISLGQCFSRKFRISVDLGVGLDMYVSVAERLYRLA